MASAAENGFLPGQTGSFNGGIGCSYGLSTGRSGQGSVELSSDVALQAADDLGLGLAFLGASLDVGAGRPMPGHPPDRDQGQRPVRFTVAATIEAVPGGLAGGGRDGRDPAQLREGGLAVQPLGVVAASDQQRRGRLGPTPLTATSAGAAVATSRSSCTSSAVISWVSCCQRPATDRSASLAASVGVAGVVRGRSRAAVVRPVRSAAGGEAGPAARPVRSPAGP
jgi:hypothetical protein